ncbi:MAG TPA: hypothetical protein VFK62_07065, partial [Gaiellaceae bacterium]|nr:hypothetical protein [Gaiellaceae bacterium]
MTKFAGLARLLGGRRRALVLSIFALVLVGVGAGSVLAGGAPRGVALKIDGPVARAPHALGGERVYVGHSVKNDRSVPLRSQPRQAYTGAPEMEASPNPRPVSRHVDAIDTVKQTRQFAARMPSPSSSFDGIPFPGVSCSCAPPDTDGEVGATQYVQIVNEGLQVFDKSTKASVLGPVGISTLWNGFGGVCQSAGDGDPVVLYDQLANRWVVTQFAGSSVPTDECIAVSTSSDATGSWNRYDFHLGSDFFDYPKLGVWPDAYYMTMNVFNSAGTSFLGPQPFAFNRAAMLAGSPATFVTTRDASVFSPSNDALLPADLDG